LKRLFQTVAFVVVLTCVGLTAGCGDDGPGDIDSNPRFQLETMPNPVDVESLEGATVAGQGPDCHFGQAMLTSVDAIDGASSSIGFDCEGDNTEGWISNYPSAGDQTLPQGSHCKEDSGLALCYLVQGAQFVQVQGNNQDEIRGIFTNLWNYFSVTS